MRLIEFAQDTFAFAADLLSSAHKSHHWTASWKPINRTSAHSGYAACVVGVQGDKTARFGLLKRGISFYTETVPNASEAILQTVIRDKANVTGVICTDLWRSYYGLIEVGFDKHLRVNHDKNGFARGNANVNEIESFWSLAKRRLVIFNGVPRHTCHSYLKKK